MLSKSGNPNPQPLCVEGQKHIAGDLGVCVCVCVGGYLLFL